MKILKSKFLKQMIIIITVTFIVFTGILPSKVYANKSEEGFLSDIFSKPGKSLKFIGGVSTGISGESDWGIENIFGNTLKELLYLFVGIGDIAIAAMQVTLLGDKDFWVSTMLSNRNENLGEENEDSGSWLYANKKDVEALQNGEKTDRGTMLVIASDEGLRNGLFRTHWKVPNMLYSPENIFSNRIAALDANYINPHKYDAVRDSEGAEEEAISFAESISPTIASWYRAFRNIAIVGLLSVLVYMGIRILIGTISEKAKYKERLQDWLIALCLVFFMHFIMAGIMMLAEKITDLFDSAVNSKIIVCVDDGTIFRTNFTGYIRFAAQSDAWTEACAYGIMYFIIIGIIARFTFVYMKRALYIAFFTMIAPLVALTYPIDKIKDGKAQAFDMWVKEYFINAILQPIHLVLYCSLVGVSISLVVENPIYGIVALLFISTAEKWIKKMFKIDQAQLTSSSLGDVAVLGSMLGMGKNVIGGIAKGALTVGTAAATGGLSAVGSGLLASKFGAPARAAMAVAGKVKNHFGENVEDSVNSSTEPAPVFPPPPINSQPFTSSFNYRDFMNELDDNNDDDDDSDSDKKPKRKKRKLLKSKKDNPIVNAFDKGKSFFSQSAQPSDNLENLSRENENETGKSSTNNTENDPYKSDYVKDKLNKKLKKKATEKDESEKIKDVANQLFGGIVGGVGGVALGATMAGATGENKMIPATALGGATFGAGVSNFGTQINDAKVSNNVSILVKANVTQNADLLKSVAQVATKEKWSEDTMKSVAGLAEKHKDLEKDLESQKHIIEQFKNAGVDTKMAQKVVKDIIKVQANMDKKKSGEK